MIHLDDKDIKAVAESRFHRVKRLRINIITIVALAVMFAWVYTAITLDFLVWVALLVLAGLTGAFFIGVTYLRKRFVEEFIAEWKHQNQESTTKR